MVRLNNIRRIHFSRNPKIAQYMHEYDLVKEFGEGVDRLFREMESAGNPAPEYKLYDFMLKAKLSSAHRESDNGEQKNQGLEGGQTGGQTGGNSSVDAVLNAIIANPTITRIKLSEITGIAPSAVQKHINKLKKQKIIARRGGDFGGHWEILQKNH